jgi:hypothetical protein
MESQSQIETSCAGSRYWAQARHHEVVERERRRRYLQYVSIPGVIVGVAGMVRYVTLPYPAAHWYIGLASVIVVAFFLCLPSGMAHRS